MTKLNAIANNHNWSEVYNLAENYQQQQQWQPAAVAFQRAIQLRPDFFWSYHHLGDVLTNLQQWQQASVAYSHAVKIDSNFFWSWHNLGDAFTKLRQWKKAIFAYHHAVQIDPNFFWSWHNLGDALIKLQQWDKAIAIYLQAIQLQPEHQLTYQKIGTAFKQRGSLEESIQYYRRLIQSPDHDLVFDAFSTKPQSLLKIADKLVTEHQIDAAIALYYMVIEIQPNQASVLVKLSKLLQEQNQLQRNIISSREKLHSELLTRQEANIVNIKTTSTPDNIPGEIVIKTNIPIAADKLEELCRAVGWSSRPQAKVKKALEHSFRCVTAWHFHNEQQRFIGFARAVSDGAFHAVLLDILVHPDFQNRSIGKKIVRALIKQLQEAEIQDITLFASPHIVDFYHKLGFVSQPNNLQWMLLNHI